MPARITIEKYDEGGVYDVDEYEFKNFYLVGDRDDDYLTTTLSEPGFLSSVLGILTTKVVNINNEAVVENEGRKVE